MISPCVDGYRKVYFTGKLKIRKHKSNTMKTHSTDRQRWLALLVLCLGVLMIVLDTTIVNVALPSIKNDLKFSETALVWVVNAYMLTFGGFLLLGGRLGDLFGHRKLFLLGIVLFTVASLACGLANSQWLLITARAAQGLGGALGLAALASAAAAMTSSLMGSGVEAAVALNAGYQLAFNLGAAFAAVAGFIGFALLKKTVKPER